MNASVEQLRSAKRRAAPEIIGFHFGSDMREISDGRYQRYANPAIYVFGNDYYAAHSNNTPPKHNVGGPWQEIAEYYGRKIYCADAEQSVVQDA